MARFARGPLARALHVGERRNAPIPPIPRQEIPPLSAGCNVPPFPRVEPTGRRHVFRVNPPRGTSWSRIPAARRWSSRHSRSRGVYLICLREINVVSRTTERVESERPSRYRETRAPLFRQGRPIRAREKLETRFCSRSFGSFACKFTY